MNKIILLLVALIVSSCGKGKINKDDNANYLYLETYQNITCQNCLYVKVNKNSLTFIFNEVGIDSCEKNLIANIQTRETIRLPQQELGEIELSSNQNIDSGGCYFNTLQMTIRKNKNSCLETNNSCYELLTNAHIFTFIKEEN